jgi:peptidoglycan hydrolase CwlO-like protein
MKNSNLKKQIKRVLILGFLMSFTSSILCTAHAESADETKKSEEKSDESRDGLHAFQKEIHKNLEILSAKIKKLENQVRNNTSETKKESLEEIKKTREKIQKGTTELKEKSPQEWERAKASLRKSLKYLDEQITGAFRSESQSAKKPGPKADEKDTETHP